MVFNVWVLLEDPYDAGYLKLNVRASSGKNEENDAVRHGLTAV